MITPLQKAAQKALHQMKMENWNWASTASTNEKRSAHSELQKALDAEIAQAVEPFAWFGADGVLHRDKPHEAYGPDPRPLYLHPPQPQATTAVPEGYVLVPIESTDEELANGVRAMRLFVTKNSLIDFSLGYKAMLAAAQGEKP